LSNDWNARGLLVDSPCQDKPQPVPRSIHAPFTSKLDNCDNFYNYHHAYNHHLLPDDIVYGHNNHDNNEYVDQHNNISRTRL